VATDRSAFAPQDVPFTFDTSIAHVARVYDYWLGGKDNFAADRLAGDQAIETFPDLPLSARSNRAFLARAVRYLAGEAGIRQFLDIGTGIPTANNTHEVAQSVAPDCRVAYVDNDPIVLAHARALLIGAPEGLISYIDADLRDTSKILDEAAETLDFSRPVAVMLLTIMQLIADADDPYGIVAKLLAAVPAGSFLALSHPASDLHPDAMREMAKRLNKLMAQRVYFRGQADVARFFDGLELVAPGVVRLPDWRPDTEAEAGSPTVIWGGIGRKLDVSSR